MKDETFQTKHQFLKKIEEFEYKKEKFEYKNIDPCELINHYLNSFFIKFKFTLPNNLFPENEIDICYWMDEGISESGKQIIDKLLLKFFSDKQFKELFAMFHSYRPKEYLIVPQSTIVGLHFDGRSEENGLLYR